jgi:membrane peptidoglycan carboxypeptidase
MNDQLNKAVMHLVDDIRDTVVQNIVTLVISKKFKIERVELEQLTAIVKSTIDATFQKGAKNLDRTVSQLMKDEITKKEPVTSKKSKT